MNTQTETDGDTDLAKKIIDYLADGQPTLHEKDHPYIDTNEPKRTMVDGWIDFVDLAAFVRRQTSP
jgi:hypothetical protein